MGVEVGEEAEEEVEVIEMGAGRDGTGEVAREDTIPTSTRTEPEVDNVTVLRHI